MARGALAKEIIKEKILDTFKGSFTYSNGKEIRIPIEENGSIIQIKIQMTAAKDNVLPPGTHGDPVGEPGEPGNMGAAVAQETGDFMNFPTPRKKAEITEEEKQNVNDLLKALGLD